MRTDGTGKGLGDLSLETWQQIARHLHETHRPSLYAFSLANKACHEIALPQVHREIHLIGYSREILQRDVDALMDVLSRNDSLRHVRYLSIKGYLRMDLDVYQNLGEEIWASRNYALVAAWSKSNAIEPDEEQIDHGPLLDAYRLEHEIARSSNVDKAWAPLVSLVSSLPRLETLVYHCLNPFPPRLLDTLHEYHPRCRLHHLTFRLRSLLSDAPHPDEMKLATSPCLYKVKVALPNTGRDHDGWGDFNEEAAMELAAGLAPNLKELVIVAMSPFGTRNGTSPRGTWKSFPGFIPNANIGCLSSLSLIGSIHWSPDFIQKWAKYTDFTSLQYLALGVGKAIWPIGMTGEMLQWIAHNCFFPRLKVLRIRLNRDNRVVERSDYGENVITFFKTLEPLEELSICGPLEPKILEAVLSRHGQRLRVLNLRPREHPPQQTPRPSSSRGAREIPMLFRKEHVLHIQTQCPQLEELSIPVKRTKSDAVEAEIYKTFGKMKRLRTLCLTLDCSEWRVIRDDTYNPSFDGVDDEPCENLKWLKKGQVRETFLNCAVDEALARSIWDTICQHKKGTPLRSLKLWTTGGGQYGDARGIDGDIYFEKSHFPNITAHLSRSWLFERVVGDLVSVTEQGRHAREMRDKELRQKYKNARRPNDFTDERVGFRIFRSIWPSKEGSIDWREDWSSLPLQLEFIHIDSCF